MYTYCMSILFVVFYLFVTIFFALGNNHTADSLLSCGEVGKSLKISSIQVSEIDFFNIICLSLHIMYIYIYVDNYMYLCYVIYRAYFYALFVMVIIETNK